jgi:hypothetical protein
VSPGRVWLEVLHAGILLQSHFARN